jgi:hypothetical protein
LLFFKHFRLVSRFSERTARYHPPDRSHPRA